MEKNPLLPLPDGMLIEQIQIIEAGLLISVVATHPTSCCPLCSSLSSSIHSTYSRTLQDVPCAGRQVRLLLTVRKFFCHNPVCSRKVFTERVPQFVKPWARMTIRLVLALQSIGSATSGNAGKRLAERLSIQTSRQTILRRIMDIPPRPKASVLYLGLDDFSFRRGYRYGTICVNLESHQVVDVLPDRRVETVVRWMRQHPDITVVSRDRGGEYASAARDAAPQAIQVADKFHLVKNLIEVFQLLLTRCQAEFLGPSSTEPDGSPEQTPSIITLQEWRPPEPACVKKARLTRRAERLARYQKVVDLHKQGYKPKEIAGQVGLSDRTVQHWLAAGAFPEARKRRKRQTPFEAFAPYVLKRWQDGERRGAATLFREIQDQGYTGSDRRFYRYLSTLKQAEVRVSTHATRLQQYTPRTSVWLFVRDPDTLDEIEREDLAAFCQASPALTAGYQLAQDFLGMVHKREGERLDTWLTKVGESDLPELQSFASGIEKDKAAVQAGLTHSINNGMVEGHVTKLKLIKRQMYGKAGFALLRQRVLHAV